MGEEHCGRPHRANGGIFYCQRARGHRGACLCESGDGRDLGRRRGFHIVDDAGRAEAFAEEVLGVADLSVEFLAGFLERSAEEISAEPSSPRVVAERLARHLRGLIYRGA